MDQPDNYPTLYDSKTKVAGFFLFSFSNVFDF